MAQQFLDRAQVGAAGEEVGGEGVAQGVGGGVFGQSVQAAEVAQDFLGDGGVEAVAAGAGKESGAAGVDGHERAQGGHDGGEHGDEALFVAFAEDAQCWRSAGFGDVAHVQRQGFGDAQAAAVEESEEGFVARLDVGHVAHDADVAGDSGGFVLGEGAGEGFAGAGGGEYSAVGVSIKPAPTTTLGNGTDPSNASLAPGGSATMADAFTLQTSSGSDSITAATITLARAFSTCT